MAPLQTVDLERADIHTMLMLRQHEIEIRIRYHETDAQGHVHHATYFNWFELGRVELMRASGRGYEQIEAAGLHLVVADISCRYYHPCRFGDAVQLCVNTLRARGARIDHEYRVTQGEQLLAEGKSTIACIDHHGRVHRLPDWLTE